MVRERYFRESGAGSESPTKNPKKKHDTECKILTSPVESSSYDNGEDTGEGRRRIEIYPVATSPFTKSHLQLQPSKVSLQKSHQQTPTPLHLLSPLIINTKSETKKRKKKNVGIPLDQNPGEIIHQAQLASFFVQTIHVMSEHTYL